MSLPSQASVLIVGAGPCGLMLAIELGRRGISTTLVDEDVGTAVSPQANATQARTMEHFRRLGFAEEIRSLGLPPDYPTDIAYFTRYARFELARFELPASRSASVLARSGGDAWSAAELPHRVSQKFVERVLLRQATREHSVSIHFGWQFESFVEESSGVTALVINKRSGERRSIIAQYLIGADGARSAVRRQLGLAYLGDTAAVRDFLGGRMVSVHLRAPDFYKVMPHSRAWMYWAFNSQRRSWLAAVNGKDEFAFHCQLKADEEQQVIDHARARELFSQSMGVPLEIEVLGVDTWIAGHALVAERFGRGRVFIAGDAAHLFTPAGGLGYNTAVEDAVNLGWKLALVVKGADSAELLASYDVERRGMAMRNTAFARQFADSIGLFVPHPSLESNRQAGETARGEARDYLNAHARKEFRIPGVTFGGRYDGSAMVVPDGTDPPPDSANSYTPTATPGGRAPHFWLEDGGSLYDLFGFEWTLLRFGAPQADVIALQEVAKAMGVDVKVVDISLPAACRMYETKLALVRPDQIIAWRGNRIDAQVYHYLTRVTGHVPASSSQSSC